MTTGTEGNDNLQNTPNVVNEIVDALGGDDSIRLFPTVFMDSTIDVLGGSGSDSLTVGDDGNGHFPKFRSVIGAGTSGSMNVVWGAGSLQAGITFDSIEALFLDGDSQLNAGDVLTTGESADSIRLRSTSSGAYRVSSGGGNDQIFLNGASISVVAIDAGAGNDLIDTSGISGILGGSYSVAGGTGDDVYVIGNVSPVVIENAGEGTDEVRTTFGSYTLQDNVENLTGLLASGQSLTGNSANNVIIGAGGNDRLDGGAGADHLEGGLGSDQYFVDALDTIVDSGGTLDQVYASSSYALAAGLEVEILATTASAGTVGFRLYGNDWAQSVIGTNGADEMVGGGGDDGLYGHDGVDIMDGGEGADVMDGGTGGDIYFVDNVGDVVIERDGEGSDYLYTSVSYALGAGSYVEFLATTNSGGTGAIDLAGSDRDNTITGNDGVNTLTGGGGSDNLRGLGGNDLLDGGRGQDFLEGGAGADTFRFEFASDSALGAADAIFDFVSGTDKLDLALIDADSGAVGDQAFTFLGSAAFSGRAGELRAESIGNTTHIIGDVNGDGVADLHIILYNSAGVTAGDFVL